MPFSIERTTVSHSRIFKSANFMQSAEGEPVRSVVTQSGEAVVVAWHVLPGQRIASHVHPTGQDTWTILSGSGAYQLDADGTSHSIAAGDVIVAEAGMVHGVLNDGQTPLEFISVVSPADAGYMPI